VKPDPLDTLLQKLTAGDNNAAQQVFLAYEPYLRMVVRRHLSPGLRAKFDSADVVQSVWADVLVGFREAGWQFADAAHLRAFLIRLTRHRFIDRVRKHRRAVERERSLAGEAEPALTAADPRPSEVLAADELWEQILEICPPEHRELLQLKRQGVPNSEVAARTGLHEGSVRRILCELSRRLARRRAAGGPAEP
jgi:RNA polymerase sigma-70 factor (ECF subfamily)